MIEILSDYIFGHIVCIIYRNDFRLLINTIGDVMVEILNARKA